VVRGHEEGLRLGAQMNIDGEKRGKERKKERKKEKRR